MPIFRTDAKLVYYAHVPKCGGSAVNWYLTQRFGPLAMTDARYTSIAPARRWNRTSPQHIDRESLERLFPLDFFDAVFSIVRHPVTRILSAYHFQRDVEQSLSSHVDFSDWLADLPELMEENVFAFDNHVRPMTMIVPEGATVFHVEHGLDHIIPWFDRLTGTQAAPRAIPKINEQGQYSGRTRERVTPSPSDLEVIARVYAEDFERFGYRIDDPAPVAAAPVMSEEDRMGIEATRKAMNSPMGRLRRKLARAFS